MSERVHTHLLPVRLVLVERLVERVRTFGRMFGRSVWQALVSFYHSEDLTFATSIAFYALLSLFPFFLLLL